MNDNQNTHIEALVVILLILSLFLFPSKIEYLLNLYSCDGREKYSLTPPPIPDFKWEKTGLITLWFDDGWLSQYETAFKIMQQANLKGAISVATSLVCHKTFVTWKDLRIMQENGWETTSHSVTHNCDLNYYNDETTRFELSESKKIIQSYGLRADQFVMPCGYEDSLMSSIYLDKKPPIIADAKKYYDSYRTTKSKRMNTIPVSDPYNLKSFQIRNITSIIEVQNAINDAKTTKSWLILTFHQIDDSNQFLSIPVERFKAILNLVEASGLPVVLPSQVLKIK